MLTSKLFFDEVNEVKQWFVLMSMLILLLVCSMRHDGISSLYMSVHNGLFKLGISSLGIVVSVVALMQYVGFATTNNVFCRMTGAFDNTAGLVSAIGCMFPFAYAMSIRRQCGWWQRLVALSSVILMAVTIILSASRSGWLMLITIVVVQGWYRWNIKTRIRRRWLLLSLLLLPICITFIYALYRCKQDSADGRFLVWSVCAQMVGQHPLVGFGHEGMLAYYMPAQAQFLAAHHDSARFLLADNINHPYNEYVKLTVMYGIPSFIFALLLLACLLYGIRRNAGQQTPLALSLVTGIMVLCQFSYPYNYSVVWFVTLLIVLYAIPLSAIHIASRYAKVRHTICFLTLSALLLSGGEMYYHLKWAAISRRSLAGQTEKMLPHYEHILPYLRYNPMFLYNYAAELNFIDRYDESLQLTRECLKHCNDYDVQMLLSDNYEHLGCTDSALAAYTMASQMIPSRFVPLSAMLDIYLEHQDIAHADSIAMAILTKPVKVSSDEIDGIRRKAKSVINKVK